HIHLCAKSNEPPFRVPLIHASSHPANHARMRVMLYGLRLISFEAEADQIEKRWNQLLSIASAEAEAEYLRCFPEDLLEKIAVKAYEGVYTSGLHVVSPDTDLPVYNILNHAWEVFWAKPATFSEWERQAVLELRKLTTGLSVKQS